MAYLDTRQAFQDLKASTLEGLKTNFPIEGKKNVIELAGLEVRDQHLDPDDIEAQYNAKVEGRSWGAPVFGTLVMKDKTTGQVLDQKKIKLADIPHMTKRHAYIVNGNEYQVDSQWRLKPGVYVRRKESGELESRFQVPKGSFSVLYDKDKKVFRMSRGKSEAIPVYPLMKELGVDDDTLVKHWGKEVLEANQAVRAGAGALEAFFRADKKRAPKDKDEARQYFHEVMRTSQLRPEATKISMGKAFDHVDGELVTRATGKMLNVMNGVEQADERDALMFKDLYTVADFTKERLQSPNVQRAIQKRVARKIDAADNIRQVIKGGMFSDPVRQTFTDNALARGADQVNPVEMLSSSFQTSVMGPGGIQSEQSVSDEAKLINPSHLGFLDPIKTPEGCFDEATEVFTEEGWVSWGEVRDTTRFACLVGGTLEFHEATDLQKYRYQGRMYGVRRPQLEYLVTPNHRMLCRPFGGANYSVVPAAEMHGKPRVFTSTHAPVLTKDVGMFQVPHVVGNNSSVIASTVKFDVWAELVGWYVSEGSYRYNPVKSSYFVHLFQSTCNSKECARIEWLLDQLPYKWGKKERDRGRNRYTIGVKQLASYMSKLGRGAPNKCLPDDFMSWPVSSRRTLMNAMLWGDGRVTAGHRRLGRHTQNSFSYTTTSKKLAQQFEMLAISLGNPTTVKLYKDKRAARYHDVYEVRLLQRGECSALLGSKYGANPYYTVEYDGFVYCASVPGTFLYVRRNGKRPVWLGNSKTGVTLRLPMGATKRGNQPVIPVYSIKTGKLESIDPATFHQSRVVLPDQVKWVNGKPVPVSEKVAISQKGNELSDSKFSEAEYVMRSPSQMFSMTSNLIPFLGNNSGNRATYGAAQMEQAISLQGREKPLVQVGTGSSGIKTFEDFVGRNSAHVSAVDGTVTDVSPGSITIKQPSGELRKVSIYNNFPLNDHKAVLHSEPTVSVGQQVKKGDLLADNNFTRDGSLALGTNLTVGYIPFKGLNFEDGVVISESAAKKMASIHMHKPVVEVAPEYITDPNKYRVLHPTAFTKEQFSKVGDNGVVKVGQRVSPGDPLVLATKPYESRGSLSLGKLRKSLSTQHMDSSLVWKSDYQGEVVGVHKDGKGNVTVHVRTVEPMQIGDKMTGRAGNKGIVTTVLPDHEMPQLKNGAQMNVGLRRAEGTELQSDLVVGGKTYKAGTKLDQAVLAEIRQKDPTAVAHIKQHLEAVLNPSGVPGRMNMGQVLETAASKLAQKTGKTYIVENFISHPDAITQIQKELKDAGVDDQDEVIDPVTGQNLGKALTGPQHMFKLNFQIDKKVSVRSGMPLEGAESEGYDPTTLIPSSGGKTGGQSMGNLGMYSLLAHGAKHNIREMQTWKSEGPDPTERWNSLHNEVWRAIQTGEEPPPPKKTFAFQKFEDMMRAAGINIERKGHSFQMLPLTDAQVMAMSSGKIEDERASVGWGKDRNGEPIPKKGGIFDPKLTGGHGGKRWSHMELPEPMPNPVFEGAIQHVLGITRKQYTNVVHGDSVVHNGQIVPYDPKLIGAKTGGTAIYEMLGKLDVKKELDDTTKKLNDLRLPVSSAHSVSSDVTDDDDEEYVGGKRTVGIEHRTGTQKVDTLAKKVRMLRALDHAGITPQDAYTIRNLPVIPPVMRPVSFLPSGDIHEADLNKLYTDFGGIVHNMKDPTYIKDVPDSQKRDDRANLYDGMRALIGTGPNWDARGKNPKGLLLQVAGKQPKTGYFQDTLLSRRQDMTMRGTITPEPHMSIDEVGLPTHKGLDLFRPFVVKKLQDLGAASSPREAQKLLATERKKKEPSRIVTKALDLVMSERPVLLKRDPSLHKHSVQAFNARRAPGKAIQIHPLVTGGFGADFDGDTIAVYVPVGREAVNEAYGMLPSRNLYNEATGKVMYTPSLESSLGLFKLSRVTGETQQKFATHADLLKAAQAGKISMTDVASVGDKRTTAGRVMLASAVPDAMSADVMHDLSFRLNKKGVTDLYTKVAKDHREDFGDVAGKLMNLGYDASYGSVKLQNPMTKGTASAVQQEGEDPSRHVQFIQMGTHSFGLSDFTPDKAVRDRIVRDTQRKVDAIHARPGGSSKEKERESINLWFDATERMEKEHDAKATVNPTNLRLMREAGVKPGPDQYRQLTLAPMLLTDSTNRILPKPVTKSYSEGLDLGSYWNQMSGARRGSVLKVQEVRDPGYFTKLLMNTALGSQVSTMDCGTSRGIPLNIGDQGVYDRELIQDVSVKGHTFKRGTTLTPDIVQTIKSVDKNAQVLVRSPLKCEHGKGLCQKCAGLAPDGDYYKMGTNVGVLSTQALGERSTQLTLKAFHSGGIAVRDAGLVNDFKRVLELTHLPQKIPDSATVAMKGGTITKIEDDPTGVVVWIRDTRHHIPKDRFGNPLWKELPGSSKPGWQPPKVGMHVQPGQTLSDPARTNVNVRDLYKATNSIEQVQNHLVNELHGIYGKEGVRRQHIELVVRNLSDLTRVVDPGDDERSVKGDFTSTSALQARNKELAKQGLKPAMHTPVLKGIDVLPLESQEDWMAKMNHNHIRGTVVDAATYGHASNIHSTNPVAGMAYGAEFGMTEKDRFKKPQLANVPSWAY